MVKYFVRTTGERKLDESYKQIEYTLLVDTEHKAVESFINQLKEISDFDSVLLEDDLILCNNFKEKIEEVISNYPDRIINFFSRPTMYFKTRNSDNFVYNQCTYYPKGLGKQIAEKMKDMLGKYKEYDVLEDRALRKLHILHIIYRPCLVQHLDNDTLMGRKPSWFRRSIWFIDYLDELNIPYDDANSEENIKKLTELMLNKFKKIGNEVEPETPVGN